MRRETGTRDERRVGAREPSERTRTPAINADDEVHTSRTNGPACGHRVSPEAPYIVYVCICVHELSVSSRVNLSTVENPDVILNSSNSFSAR